MLRDAVPLDKIKLHFPETREEVLAQTVSEFVSNRSRALPAICLFVWDEMVHRGETSTPFKIAPIIHNGFKGIKEFVREELGQEPISAAFSAKYYNDVVSEESFADVSLVKCFPNDIHIADVEFSDNRKPLKKSARDRERRKYRGLHVFDAFIDRLKEVGRSEGADRISLIVAAPPLYEVFSRHGFVLSQTKMSILAYESSKQGFAMIQSI